MHGEHSRFVGLPAIAMAGFLWVPFATADDERGKTGTFVVRSRLDYYTNEKTARLLVEIPRSAEGKTLAVNVRHGSKPLVKGHVVSSRRPVIVPLALEGLSEGDTELACDLTQDGNVVAEAKVRVRKLPHKPNAVKIDRLTGGMIVDGLPFFPFGFYCYSPVQPMLAEEEVVRGFSIMSPYQDNQPESIAKRRAYMDRCATLDMKVHYQLLSIAGGGGVYGADPKTAAKQRALLEAEVRAFRDHPALLAWYISDEPTGSKVPPDRLAKTRALIKQLDPYHPVTVVFMAPKAARRYADCMDIVMTDIYPIPHGPVASTGDATDFLVKEFAFDKPVWFVPQAFGGGEWWRREPTPQEERIMTYLPVIRGATGIQYFIRHGQNGFPKSTSVWAECGRLALEMSELAPAVLSDEPRPEVVCSPSTVAAAAWRDRGMITVLAANIRNAPDTLRLEVKDAPFTGRAAVPFENRHVAVRDGVIEEMIDAYGTRAYQIPVGPLPDETLQVHISNRVTNPSFEDNPTVGTPAGCYANVGAGRGATYFVDPRVARHGRHSLRMHTPAKGQGCVLSFFPFRLAKNEPFRVSIWAKAKPLPMLPSGESSSASPQFTLSFVGGLKRTFTPTPEWREYAFAGQAGPNGQRAGVSLTLSDPGTAWFDLLQVTIDPTITADANIFADTLDVAIGTAAEEGEIRYTLDGTDPTPKATPYKGPFTIAKTTTLRAGVFKDGQLVGGIARATFTQVELRPPASPGNVVAGLDYAYYLNTDRRRNVMKPAKSGTIAAFSLDPRTRDEFFGFQFNGFIRIPRDGVYTFTTRSDDASKLFIGDELVVSNDGLHEMRERSGAVALEAGLHPISVSYFQHDNEHGLEVSYSGPRIEKQPIPAEVLFRSGS